MASEEQKQEKLDTIVNRKKLGGKRFHSESELQQYGEDEESLDNNKDPGVLNVSVSNLPTIESANARQRASSQPGPLAGNLVTASAMRANRKRPIRNVNYAVDLEASDFNDAPSKYLSPKGDESGTATPNGTYNGERVSPLPSYNNYRANGDVKSISSYRIYTPVADGRGGATPRKRSVVTMDAQSIRSVETQAPPPTSPEENKKHTRNYLSLLLSVMYAVLLVTLGLLIHIGDVFLGETSVSAYYSIALFAVGFLYHLYLIFDIIKYRRAIQKQQKLKDIHENKMEEYFRNQEEENGMNPSGNQSLDFRSVMPISPLLIPVKHDYCFSTGRHSGSFYLKLGAAAFALGHLIHSVLLITVQMGYLFDETIDNDKCVSMELVALDFISPVYGFFQLFFIFKYSNVIILKNQSIAHFGFMHMIGSSLCFWISAIVRETVLSLTLYVNARYENGYGDENASNYTSIASSENEYKYANLKMINVDGLYDPECIGNEAISNIVENFSPYLYPFSVEFNILIVGVYYIIWTNIANCESVDDNLDDVSFDDNNTVCKANSDSEYTGVMISADCHASTRGVFAGLILIVIVAGSLIIGFVFNSTEDDTFLEVGNIINNCMKLSLHSIMLIVAVFAFWQTCRLDINHHPMSLLDDVLLFVCLPAFFIESTLSLLATITFTNVVRTVDFVIMVIQVIIQTPLIMDGLRRCSNTRKFRRTKPGRELIMFLIISNVGMWLFNTFSYKSPDSMDERYEYYGKVLWTILGHISLPLIMFYRFHSSVCFADIWDSAYKPGSDH